RDHEFMVEDSDYESRIYCAQYRETNFNFVSRLLEEEGIFYFFRHEQGRHVLVLADAPGHHAECPHQSTARCAAGATFDATEPEVITSFQKMQEIRFGAYTLRDYNSELQDRPIIQVDVESKYAIGPGTRELYDYPGLYSSKKSGDRLVNIRMQEEEARVTTITGSSFCRAFTAGAKIKVRDPEDFYRDDLADRDGKDYILVSVSHMASQRIGPSGRGEGGTYANNFSCLPDDPNVPYRPPRYTPKPVVQGTQTAIVVGRRSDEESDEEIYTDGPCQIKVRFHWDRSDQESDQKSDHSCWIRVAQLWAGTKWGGVYVPRIGQEVIVDFLEGDPDRPIIIGCVYNAINPPPYEDGKTSGIKSNTTKGGGGYNEISMTDTKDEEAITIHAQKDMNTTVENDQSVTLKSGSRTITVESGSCSETSSGDHSITSNDGAVKITGKGKGVDITGNELGVGIIGFDQGVSIVGWDRGVEIQANDAPATIQGNTDGVTITGKGKGVTVDGKAGDGVKIIAGGQEVTVDGQTIKITGKNSIVLSGGGSKLTIDAKGVNAEGKKINLN
ncbi:MAG TPA: type VI secretion system tip protein VgrG, partial [Desulfobacterales bacterium]|nr:type VI secretion system tip protein VgrG [Desulfobacterales bacterium]